MSRRSVQRDFDPDSLVHTKSSKNIRAMFDAISPTYDFLNHLLSANIDRRWRQRLTKEVIGERPARILDVCTGTADLLLELAQGARRQGYRPVCVGTDFALAMLQRGERKRIKAGLRERFSLAAADTLALPFRDETFDLVTVAFGIRNVENLQAGLRELWRVTRGGGRTAVLEFSQPRNPLVRRLYQLYSLQVMPWVGRLITGTQAYAYLPKSVRAFPEGEAFLTAMTEAGWVALRAIPLTWGIATLYLGKKPEPAPL